MRFASLALLLAGCAACAACSDTPGSGDDTSPDATMPPGSGHPFGTHTPYAMGTQLPEHPQADLDGATTAFYDQWKSRYLVAGCNTGEYRVKTAPATTDFTVSEGHGYGMLVVAIMEGHDPDARKIFDGLYAYYAGHPSTAHPALMAWAQNEACADVEGADSATDGDFDIAYALLLADRQWGSAGAIDYKAAATKIIAAMLAYEIHPASSILVGDWADATDTHYTGTRTSDFMTGHFRAFAAVGDPRWSSVADHTYTLVAYLQAHASAATGLLPDFVTGATGAAPIPAPANWLEGADDGHYSYNACRVPWRLGVDAIVSGEARARSAVAKLENWLRTETAGKPASIKDGYLLDGTAVGTDPSLAFVAPAMVGAMLEVTPRTWLTALWDATVARAVDEYYGDSLKLLAMITASNNWWTPTP